MKKGIRSNLLRTLRHGSLGITALLLMGGTPAITSADAGGEGIKVHGEWELIVADPDGTVVKRVGFSNALLQGGSETLVVLLTGQGSIGRDPTYQSLWWDLVVRATGLVDSNDCNRISGNESVGASPEIASTVPTRATVTADRYTFQLSRDLKMPADCVVGDNYTINEVSTTYQLTGDIQNNAVAGGFSSKVLDTPLVVLPGQVVTMVVTYSFS
jgi:hypothetical protein